MSTEEGRSFWITDLLRQYAGEHMGQDGQFYYLMNGSTLGPVDRQQLQRLVDNRTIVEATPVKLEHDGDWRAAETWGLQFVAPNGGSLSMATWIWIAMALSAAAYFFWPAGFSDADIERVRQSIRQEYAKKEGITVVDVTMIKKSNRELTGFVQLKASAGDDSQTVDCTASMAESGGQYIWRCGR